MKWYPWYPVEFRRDTLRLSLAEEGAYRRLLDEYMITRGSLPDDDMAIARIVGVGMSEWQTVAPALPREGRVMRQVRRCFVARGAKPLCMGDLLPWVYPRLERFKHWHRWSVRRALLRYAVPIGRRNTRGQPVIWRPNRSI